MSFDWVILLIALEYPLLSLKFKRYKIDFCIFTFLYFLCQQYMTVLMQQDCHKKYSRSTMALIDWKSICLVTFHHVNSYASAVLAVVFPSVHHTHALWQKQTMHCRYFDTTRKGNHSSFLTLTAVGGRRPLPSEICVHSDPPLQKTLPFTDFCL